jgi:hypothetical protein
MAKRPAIPALLAKADMATRWGLTRQAVNNQERRNEDFPEPVLRLANGTLPLYLFADVAKYETKYGLGDGKGLSKTRPKTMPALLAKMDIALRWDADRRLVDVWERRDIHFPDPITRVANNKAPLYLLEDIEVYEKTNEKIKTINTET